MNARSFLFEVSIGLILFVALAAVSARAEDTYNFYFQKSPQGASLAPTPPGSAESLPATPTAQNQVALAPPSVAPPFRSWRVAFGPSMVLDAYTRFGGTGDSSRMTLGVGYDFNKYLGIEGSLAFAPNTTGIFRQALFVLPTVGVTVTPIHISLFGRESISLGMQVGAMYLSTYNKAAGENYQNGGPWPGPQAFVNEAQLYPYIGLDVGFRITDSVKLLLQAKQAVVASANDEIYGTVGLGVSISF